MLKNSLAHVSDLTPRKNQAKRALEPDSSRSEGLKVHIHPRSHDHWQKTRLQVVYTSTMQNRSPVRTSSTPARSLGTSPNIVRTYGLYLLLNQAHNSLCIKGHINYQTIKKPFRNHTIIRRPETRKQSVSKLNVKKHVCRYCITVHCQCMSERGYRRLNIYIYSILNRIRDRIGVEQDRSVYV